MKKSVWIKIFIASGFFLFSLLFFTSQQNPVIYNLTLGKIASNYERTNNGNGEIVIGTQPFRHINEKDLYNWDAMLYVTIRDHLYDPTCHGHQVLQAFYPLFPMVWKLSMIDSSLIFIFNYLLFILALIILSHFLRANKQENDYFTFTTALLLPITAMFCVPYAEALFLLTFAIAVAGLFQKKYWLFFIGALAFSMTRPACLIYMVALLATDVHYFINHKNFMFFIKETGLKILPFASGFFLVILIQYLYTGSWTAYWDAQVYWPFPEGFFNPIVDWSVEGFGMDVIAGLFVAIPAFIYCTIWAIKAFKKNDIKPISLFGGDHSRIKEYIFNSSLLFIAGNLVYTFLTAGSVIVGFARYTMAVPFFYIVWFLFHERTQQISFKKKLIGLALLILGLLLFFHFVEYGAPRVQFAMSGLYIMLAVILFFILSPNFSSKTKLIVGLVLLVPAIAWQCYLFNMYLCQAWIFM